MRVRDVMSRTVTTVRLGDLVRAAAALLIERGFTALPVVDADGDLVGIVTEADLVRDRMPHDARLPAPAPGTPPVGCSIGDVVTREVIVTTPAADVAEAARSMLDHGVRALPVVDGRRVVGIVTRRDLLRVVAREDALVAADVRHRLDAYAGPGRFAVTARDGVVTIDGDCPDPADAHVITVLAGAVAGVTAVHVPGAPGATAGPGSAS